MCVPRWLIAIGSSRSWRPRAFAPASWTSSCRRGASDRSHRTSVELEHPTDGHRPSSQRSLFSNASFPIGRRAPLCLGTAVFGPTSAPTSPKRSRPGARRHSMLTGRHSLGRVAERPNHMVGTSIHQSIRHLNPPLSLNPSPGTSIIINATVQLTGLGRNGRPLSSE